jgi:tetratricopeptide (TPR) repeat protein
LQAIADTADEALYHSLAQLQAAEFLYETSLFPERAYTFKHALTHEVAYGSLLQERRRMLHGRIVAALEALARDRLDDHVERLAQHALRGEVWDKALTYGRQAGDKAQARSAYREAVVCYEQTLTVLEHLPASRAASEQAIDLRLGLRNALNPLAEEPERMLGYLRRAETLAQALGDQQRLGRVYAAMSATFWVAGEVDRAIVYGQQTLVVAATLGHVGLQAQAHHVLGHAYADAGDYGRAIESYEWNVGMLRGDLLYERPSTTGSIAASCRAWLSLCHAERGAFTEGLALAEEGLRIAEIVNTPFSQIEACQGVSAVYLRQGDVQRALPVLERAVGLCQDWHIPPLLPIEVAILGLAYVLDGRSAAGLALVEQGVEQQVARSRRRRLASAILCLSEAYLLTGRLEEARQRAVQALDLARQSQQRGNQAWALWLLGECTARQASPELAPAAGHYRQAFALAEELSMRPLQAHCHCGLGTLYARTGQRQQARAALATAIDLYRDMAMTFWLPQAQEALAQIE